MSSRVFFKLGDIEGQAQDEDHEKWIDILSFDCGVSNSIDCVEKLKGNPGGEASTHNNLGISKQVDNTSSQLYAHCGLGSMFKKATVEIWEEKELLMKVTMENVAIASIGVSGGTDGVPHEQLQIAYTKIAYQYRTDAEQDYDLVTNKSSLKKKKAA